MEKRCGCWAVLTRTVSGVCKSSASKDSPNNIPRTSLVYDSGNPLFLFPYSVWILSGVSKFVFMQSSSPLIVFSCSSMAKFFIRTSSFVGCEKKA